jgi:hypothetical protein
MKKRIIPLFTVLICAFILLSSCNLNVLRKNEESEETEDTEATEVTEETEETEGTEETTEAVPTTEASVVPSETEPPIEGAPEYLDTVPIYDFLILYLTLDYTQYDILAGQALYDMNGDGADDDIRIDFNGPESTLDISINGVTGNFSTYYFTTAYLIDIDRGDDYVDLFVQDEGLSDDQVTHIFRYTGTEIIKLGDIYGSLRANRQGQILSTNGYETYTNPVMVYSWIEILSGSIVYHQKDRDSYFGQTFWFRHEIGSGGIYLEETSTIPAYDAYPMDEAPTNIVVPAGTEFTLLDVSDFRSGDTPNWYYIQLEDGRTGVFYYMKGD